MTSHDIIFHVPYYFPIGGHLLDYFSFLLHNTVNVSSFLPTSLITFLGKSYGKGVTRSKGMDDFKTFRRTAKLLTNLCSMNRMSVHLSTSLIAISIITSLINISP